VIGTSVDSLDKLRRFRDEYKLSFPLVSDHDRAIGKAYGTLRTLLGTHERDTFLIARDGAILLAYERVGAKGHAATVLADARRLHEEGLI